MDFKTDPNSSNLGRLDLDVKIKILDESMIHNGFKYQTGLNIDTVPFNPTGSCEPGGLYFTTLRYLPDFLNYGTFIADVEVPKDARVYADPEGDKWKADKLILHNVRPIGDHECWSDMEYCLYAVSELGALLVYVKNQTRAICMEAVKQDGLALIHVQNQTPEVCMEAVKNNGLVLEFVQSQTREICLEAVKENGWALVYVQIQTPEICLEAVKRNGWAVEYVEQQTPEICLAAVKQDGRALKYVKDQTPEICLAAVKQDGLALIYIKSHTPEISAAIGRRSRRVFK